MAVKQTTTIKASMTAYSTAVGPSSDATKRFTLTVGNAGGVEIDLNGKRLPSLGAKGAVIQRLVLPPEQPGSGS